MATGRKSTVKAGGESSDVCGDVGEDTRRGLVVIGDLKRSASGQTWCSKLQQCVTLLAGVLCELGTLFIWPTLVTVLDSPRIVKPAQSTSPLV